MTRHRIEIVRAGFAIFALAVATQSVCAQGIRDTGRHASAIVGASLGDGSATPAVSLALGFWFAPMLGVEFELAYAGHFEFALDPCPAPRLCDAAGNIPVTGRTVSLVPHVVFGLPVMGSRVRPYAVVGGGVTHLRQWYFVSPQEERKRSQIVPALSFGGGVAIRISRTVALGVDVRSIRLFDDEAPPDRFIVPAGTISTLRVGSRVSWRF